MTGYTRKELKHDKFAESAQGAAQWATGHRQTVVLTVGLVLVLVIAATGFITWHSRQTEQGNTELSAGMRILEEPLTPAGAPATPGDDSPKYATITDRAKAAQKLFSSAADKYSSVAPGKIARYMSGVTLVQAGDKAGAEQELKKAVDSGDKNVSSLAKMALASLYRETNRNADAVALYKDIAANPTDTVSKSAANLELASMYETSDPGQAEVIYKQIQTDDPQSPAAQVAGQKLAGKGK